MNVVLSRATAQKGIEKQLRQCSLLFQVRQRAPGNCDAVRNVFVPEPVAPAMMYPSHDRRTSRVICFVM